MATETLGYWLEFFCDKTKNVVEGENGFSTMVFAVTAGEIFNNLVFEHGDDDRTVGEKLPRFYELGMELSVDQDLPEHIVVAEAMSLNAHRAIMVLHGSSITGERGRLGFYLSFDRQRRLHVGKPVKFGECEDDYNPAAEVLKGLRDGKLKRN